MPRSRTATTTLSLLLGAVAPAAISCTHAQPAKTAAADPCGNAATVNQAYDVAFGTVVEVISGDSIRVKIDSNKPNGGSGLSGVQAFHLVAIEAPSLDQEIGRRSQQRLKQRLAGKYLQLSLSPFQKAGTPINTMVSRLEDYLYTENLQQVEAGMAKVVEQGPYDVDWYVRCRLEKAQEAARQAGLGIWTGAAVRQPAR